MLRALLCLVGGSLCGLGIAAALGALWLIWGGETFVDHFIDF